MVYILSFLLQWIDFQYSCFLQTCLNFCYMVVHKVCVTSSVCEAQTTRRHNGLQSVCFSEVRRHKNVCARSSPHRYGIASSKVCKPFNLKKTRLFFFCFRLQSSSNPPRKNPRSIDRSYSTLQRPPPSQPSSPIKTIDRRLPLRSGVLRFSDHHSRLQQPANSKVTTTTSTSDQATTPPLLAAVNQRLPCEATGRRPSPPQLHRRLRPHSYRGI
ncbi:uncharacterized protein LOC111888992 isoform X3 [Lactuca sativa]|uniref:uncharacterized protein LOC111888992 isoform X3 n=1 Tax=Lactuca sativa TaxID=4236 RepID=UPI0022AFF172|nr:uncharacterized protein LOC111888992 isoform X3 [Lactuca sativa]